MRQLHLDLRNVKAASNRLLRQVPAMPPLLRDQDRLRRLRIKMSQCNQDHPVVKRDHKFLIIIPVLAPHHAGPAPKARTTASKRSSSSIALTPISQAQDQSMDNLEAGVLTTHLHKLRVNLYIQLSHLLESPQPVMRLLDPTGQM